MNRIRFLPAVAVLLAGGPAFAWSSQGFVWPDADLAPITYTLNPAGADDAGTEPVFEAARTAFATWESVACTYLRFEEQAWTAPSDATMPIGNDGVHRIFFAETSGDWPGNSGTLALTYVFHTLGEAQVILDADIVVNGADWNWTTVDDQVGTGQPAKVDVETVLFHEIGHFFGLNHSEDTAAAMFPSNNKQIQRAPANDDVEGICALYPNGRPLPHDPGGNTGGPVGAACLQPSDCASSACIRDEDRDEMYCSRVCEPLAPNCPAGFTCNAKDEPSYCLKPLPVDELCDQCALHEHCVTGLCVKVPDINGYQPFCSQTCDPTPGQPAVCPTGFRCQLTQQQTTQIAVCVPTTGICEPRGIGGHLEPCFGNGTCKAGHGCFSYDAGDEFKYCYALCNIGAVGYSCGSSRSVCAPVSGIQNVAICHELARAGEPCLPEQCEPNALCVYQDKMNIPETSFCRQVCPGGLDSECPANHACEGEGIRVPVCYPLTAFVELGDICRSNAECVSGLCRIYNDRRVCTQLCSTTDEQSCDTGMVCVPSVGETQGMCFPRSLVENPEPGPGNPAGYCACDFSSSCDSQCDCDPDCGGCSHVRASGASGWGGFGLGLLLMALRARRRITRARGLRRCGGSAGTG